jgi:LPXTG-motif cell wall-anchored protein
MKKAMWVLPVAAGVALVAGIFVYNRRRKMRA